MVVPVYNEAQGLEALYTRLRDVLSALPYAWQIILVDDGSRDRSWDKIKELSCRDEHVLGLTLSRNFGKEMALTAGVELCPDVDAVICIDADLQHPPRDHPQAGRKMGAGV